MLDARALFPATTLADLYDPLTMPPELVKAHQDIRSHTLIMQYVKAFDN